MTAMPATTAVSPATVPATASTMTAAAATATATPATIDTRANKTSIVAAAPATMTVLRI